MKSDGQVVWNLQIDELHLEGMKQLMVLTNNDLQVVVIVYALNMKHYILKVRGDEGFCF